jgi:rhodanese-related sulfurtransferase
MARRWRPALELPAFIAVALLCAWISNGVAGPTRRLSWLPERAVPVITPFLPTPTLPAPAPITPPKAEAPPAKSHKKAPVAKAEPGDWDPAALLARFPPLQGQAYADISGDEARWLQLHGALILDARRSDVYAAGHLPGARSLPVWEDGLAAKIAALKADPLLPIAVYCAGGDCEDSRLLAQKLWLAGYRNLRIYAGGFPDWEARGWPTHRGEAP